MCWVKCHKCGEEILIPKKIQKGKKVVKCTNPECGATASLKVRTNGNVRGLKHSFI